MQQAACGQQQHKPCRHAIIYIARYTQTYWFRVYGHVLNWLPHVGRNIRKNFIQTHHCWFCYKMSQDVICGQVQHAVNSQASLLAPLLCLQPPLFACMQAGPMEGRTDLLALSVHPAGQTRHRRGEHLAGGGAVQVRAEPFICRCLRVIGFGIRSDTMHVPKLM